MRAFTQIKRHDLPAERAGLVGRERELAELESLLLSVLGPAPVVIVHGRRGVGKTTLAAALAQRARARQMDVIWAGDHPLLDVAPHGLMILDDAGDVEPAKLVRLAELIRPPTSARLLVLCCGARQRVDRQLASWLDRAQSERGCRYLMLRPLHSHAADAAIRAAHGGSVPVRAAADISRRTAGDPSLITELTRALERDPNIDLQTAVPETIRGQVAVRLATLSDHDRHVAESAALFTGAFAVEWLARTAGLTDAEALAALRSAEDVGLIDQNGDDRFEMSAPVVRDAVRSLVFGGHLRRAHRRLAEALMTLPADVRADASAETARQYHSSRQLPGAERGVEPALQAAGHALAARAPFRAAELLELGLELCPGDQPAMQARLTGALAKAWASALCHAEAVEALELACQRMLVAGAAGEQLAELVVDVSSALPLAVSCVDATAAVRLRNVIGDIDGDVSERLESELDSRRPQLSDGARLRERMVRIAKVTGHRQQAAAVFRAATETIEVLLDPRLTRPLLQKAHEEAERIGSSAAQSLMYTVLAVAAGRAGDLVAAAELAEAGVSARGGHHRRLSEPPLAHLVQLLTQTHADPDWDDLAGSAAGLAAEYASSPYATSLLALAALARARAGDRNGARTALLMVIAELKETARYTTAANAALGPAVEAAWRLNDAGLGEQLAPIAGRLLEAGGGDFYMSQRDLIAARLAMLAGRLDDASASLHCAARELDLAGERTLRATVDVLQQQTLNGRGSARATRPDGLTRRQLEVLRLLSEGLTNQQIAERLVVSVNTVNRHVADTYRKIGASNRVAAAVYAARLWPPKPIASSPAA